MFYKLLEGQEEITDQYGNPTGSYIPIYSEVRSTMMCVSPNKGSSEVEQFGSLEDYDRTIVESRKRSISPVFQIRGTHLMLVFTLIYDAGPFLSPGSTTEIRHLHTVAYGRRT